MATHNTSSAYRMQPRDDENHGLQEEQPKRLKVVKNRRQAVMSYVSPSVLLLFLAGLLTLSLLIWNQATLTQVNAQIDSIDREMTYISSENVRMQGVLDNTQSLRVVAQRAESELGMQRPDPYQVEHVLIYEEDRVEIADAAEPTGLVENVEEFAAALFHSFRLLFE